MLLGADHALAKNIGLFVFTIYVLIYYIQSSEMQENIDEV